MKMTSIRTSIAVAIALVSPLATDARIWIPTIHGNTYKQGGTLMNQNGAPTTSQLAVNAECLKIRN